VPRVNKRQDIARQHPSSCSRELRWIAVNPPLAVLLLRIASNLQLYLGGLAIRNHRAAISILAWPRPGLPAALPAEQPQGLIQAQRVRSVRGPRRCFLPDLLHGLPQMVHAARSPGQVEYTLFGESPVPYEYLQATGLLPDAPNSPGRYQAACGSTAARSSPPSDWETHSDTEGSG
jgi:hypothetical protein